MATNSSVTFLVLVIGISILSVVMGSVSVARVHNRNKFQTGDLGPHDHEVFDDVTVLSELTLPGNDSSFTPTTGKFEHDVAFNGDTTLNGGMTVPGGTINYLLTNDGVGNATWQPWSGGTAPTYAIRFVAVANNAATWRVGAYARVGQGCGTNIGDVVLGPAEFQRHVITFPREVDLQAVVSGVPQFGANAATWTMSFFVSSGGSFPSFTPTPVDTVTHAPPGTPVTANNRFIPNQRITIPVGEMFALNLNTNGETMAALTYFTVYFKANL